MTLRYYQEEAVNAALNADTESSLLVLPTGSGKSWVIAGVIQKVLEAVPLANILVLQHRKELVEQNLDKFSKLCPEYFLQTGVYSASVGQKDIKQITFGQVQSIHNKELPYVHVLIVDECHLINSANTGTFRGIINRIKASNPKLLIIGLTATAYRMSSGLIMEGKDVIFSDITYDIGIPELITKGYLSPLISKTGEHSADLSNVRLRNGEYAIEDVEKAMSPITEAACDEIILYGKARKHWLIFATSVKHAEEFTKALRDRGVRADCVHGGMSKDDREGTLRSFESGKTQALVNCEIATTGYDFPGIDLIAIGRATKSAGLFVQICGRGLRIENDKKDCLVLDYGGNLERFGCIDNIRVKKKSGKWQLLMSPIKTCPKCGAALPTNTYRCECGYVFERAATPIDAEASEHPVLSPNSELWVQVKGTEYKVHNKVGKPPSLKAIHYCEGDIIIREFLCFEHPQGTYPHKKAHQWWARHSIDPSNHPRDSTEAFMAASNSGVKPFKRIRVVPQRDNPRFMQVLGYEYGEPEIIDPNEGLDGNIF